MSFAEFLRYILLLIFAPNSLKTMEWRMLRLLNRDRKHHDLSPVRMQEDLRTVARKHSRDMAQKDYFEHVNPRGQSPAERLKISGVTEVTSGENLAKIGGYPNPTQFAEIGLMNSPGHRANILNPLYNAVGIGVIRAANKVYYFTQNFAKRDLLFKKPFPKTIRLRRGLRVRGQAFSDVKSMLYQVRYPKSPTVLDQNVFSLEKHEFDFRIPFKDAGRYEVFLYADHEGSGRFGLVNTLEIKVKRRFFGL